MSFTWSYSHLANYETCPKRYYHYNVEKDVPEPEGEQIVEGKKLHTAFESFLLKGEDLPFEYAMHETMLVKIRDASGRVFGEQKLAITSQFQPIGWMGKGVWCRAIADAGVDFGTWAMAVDWKTGKPSDDPTQLKIIAATILHAKPALTHVKAALVFVNHDEALPIMVKREDLAATWAGLLPRVNKLQEARAKQEYPPKPSGLCRRYCAVVSCPHHGKGRY